jgi:hypothetical protein
MLFMCSGVYERCEPAKNPKFVMVIIAEEELSEDGSNFDLAKHKVFLHRDTEQFTRMSHVRRGDYIQIAGEIIFKKGIYAFIGKEIWSVNTFLMLDFDKKFLQDALETISEEDKEDAHDSIPNGND